MLAPASCVVSTSMNIRHTPISGATVCTNDVAPRYVEPRQPAETASAAVHSTAASAASRSSHCAAPGRAASALRRSAPGR